MATALFDVDTGLRIGDNYWFSSNGNIVSTGTVIAQNFKVSAGGTIFQDFEQLELANLVVSGNVTFSNTAAISYDANNAMPKQYIDVMAIVFGQ
jgi:hypothetical protein